jgi:predicted RNase H-like HicB family nuclease
MRFAMNKKLTAIIEREGDGYVALCPELDVASQGNTVDEARKNLQEALELFFETASPEEIKGRNNITCSLAISVGKIGTSINTL